MVDTREIESKPSTIVITRVPRIPLFVVTLHRLARLGKASCYKADKKWCSFDIDPIMASKWPDLRDVERVTLMYREETQ